MKSKNNKIRKLEERKIRLIRDIQLCETYKGKIVEFANSLNYQYNKGLINEKDYAQQLSNVLENRTLDQWIKYYDECIIYYKNSIDKCDEKIKVERKTEILRNRKSIAGLTALTILFLLIITYLGGTFTGFFAAGSVNVPVYDRFGDVIGKSIVNDGIIFTNTYDGLINVIIDPSKITDSSRIIIGGGKVHNAQNTIIYIDSIEGRMTITLPSDRLLTGIARCSSFDVGGFYCREWKETPTILRYEGEMVSFDVSTSGAYAGVFNSSELDPSNIEIRVKNKFGNNLSSPKIEGKTVVISANNTEINLTGITSTKIEVFIDRVEDKIIKTPIVYIPSVTLNKSVVSLPKNGKHVNAIYKCDTFNLGAFKCLEWKKTNITFEDRGDYIVFEAGSFSGYGGGIIPITKAEHLDENRVFIEDIYDLVKERDYIWTEEIPVSHYVRITFKRNLTNENDITVYARSNDTGSIEVYKKDSNDLIINFTGIQNDTKYKIPLNTLIGFQDTFDLRVIDGGIEFDYIIDPDTTPPSVNFTYPTPASGSTTLTNRSFEINVTIDEHLLGEFKFNFNYTNFTFYNDSLILMYNFNNLSAIGENQTFVADIGRYGNNGTVYGNPFFNNSGGIYGGAFEFDGVDDSINATDRGLSIGGTQVTVAVWVKTAASNDNKGIVTKGNQNTNNYNLRTATSAQGLGKVSFVITTSGGNTPLASSSTINDNKWHYITATYNGSNMTIYLDGKFDAGNAKTGTLNEVSSNITIGTYSATNGFFSGTIDEVRIWNISLTAEQVNMTYQANFYKFNNSRYVFYINKTGLDAGQTYNYSASANDTGGNLNQTELRQYTVNIPVNCGNIATSTTMNQDVNAPGTCFNITASNVELDCAGYNIIYGTGTGSNSSGINVSVTTAQTNVTIKNCKIIKASASGANTYSIIATSFQNLTIINNTIKTNGTSNNYGVYLWSSGNNTIANNTIFTNGTDDGNKAIVIETSSSNNIISNNISTNGTGTDYGIYLVTSSFHNVITSNTISTSSRNNGSSNYGIALVTQNNNNTINSNVISTKGQSSNYGIYIDTGFNTTIKDNTIYSSGLITSNLGIFLSSASQNIISSNTISSNGTSDNHNINLDTNSDFNRIENNTLQNNGSTSDAIRIGASAGAASENNNISNNTLKTIGGKDINFVNAEINGTRLIDQNIRQYQFIGLGGTLIIRNSTFGEIYFFQKVNGSGTNLTGDSISDIQFGNNSIFVNDSRNPGLNRSANITIYGNVGQSFTNPVIFRNTIACNATVGVSCFNYTSLTASTVIFNVSGFSNYSIINTTIVVENTAPTIGNVSAIAATDPVENTNRSVNFSFMASDPDGVADLNDSTALAIFNKTGEASRNATCTVGADINANSVNYTCSVNMWYFDRSGSWNVNVSVSDASGARAENSTTAGNMTGISFTLNALTAFIMNPTSLTWGTLNVVDTNQTSNNDPLGLNNTGNVDITNITVNATDLTGETDSAFRIYGENFTIANLTGGSPANECDFNTNATIPRRGQDTQINKTLMGRGNNSIATNSSREELFVCLTAMPANLTAQTYSTTQLGGWTVIIQN